MGDDVVVTYETLFELLRREKSRGELQELDGTFYDNVITYIAAKLAPAPEHDVFGEERVRSERQLMNIRKLVRELYERREKKIFDMALSSSRTGSSMMDTSNLLPEEHAFYKRLLDVLEGNRRDVLFKVLEAKDLPKKEIIKEVPKDQVCVRFTQETEQFAGEDMQLYGPYKKNAVEHFPQTLAHMLVTRGCAEIVEQ